MKTRLLALCCSVCVLAMSAPAADINKVTSFTGSAADFVGGGGNWGNNKLQIGLNATSQTFIINSGTLQDGPTSGGISLNVLGTSNTFTLTGSSTQLLINNTKNSNNGGIGNGTFHLLGITNSMNVLAGARVMMKGWNGFDGTGNTLTVDGAGSTASFSADGNDGVGDSTWQDRYTTDRINIQNGGAVYAYGTGFANFAANAGAGNYAISVNGAGGRSVVGFTAYDWTGTAGAGTVHAFNGGALEQIGLSSFLINPNDSRDLRSKFFVDGGVVSYKDASGVQMNESKAGTASGFTYAGNNALRLNNSTATDTGSYTLANNLGSKNYTRLEMINGTSSAAQHINVDGNYGGSLLFDSTVATIANGLTLTGAVQITATGAASTLTGVIDGDGSLEKCGAGNLTLASLNTFTGQLTVAEGVLSVGSVNNSGASGVLGNSASSVILGSSSQTGTLEYTGVTTASTKPFTMATGGTGAFQIDAAGTSLTLSGLITGTGGIMKTGAGTLRLTAGNTYSGTTQVNAGDLIISGAQTGNGPVVINGGKLTLANALGTSSVAVNGGTLDLNGQGLAIGSFSGSGGLISTGVSGPVMLTVDQSPGLATFSGIISDGSGTVSFTKNGSGSLTLSGNNTYTGATVVNAGNLILSGAPTGNRSVHVNSGGTLTVASSTALGGSGSVAVNTGGRLDLNGINVSVGSIGGTAGLINSGVAGPITLTVSGSDAATFAGTIQNGSGTIALVKTGSGTQTLSGTNTYTGATTVSAGVLA
ncbi:MAG: autotransporter-associated beta strand repeat-containing protein, partial [Planctomycetota bacterium]